MHGKEPCHICYIIFQPDLISGGIGTIYHQKYIAPLISDQTFPCQFLYEQREVDKQILQEIKLACQAACAHAEGEKCKQHGKAKQPVKQRRCFQPAAQHTENIVGKARCKAREP